MKTILTLTALGVLATPAFAGKPRPPRSRPAPTKKAVVEPATTESVERDIVLTKIETKAFDFGDKYGIRERTTAQPDVDQETFQLKALSNKEAVKVVKQKSDELEYCWLKVPAGKRVPTSAMLHLAIEASGSVAGAWIDGEVPASVEKCITAAAQRWTFPSADAGCEIEHGISMSTLESKK